MAPKNMTLLFIGMVFILASAIGLFYFLTHRINPPLPTGTVAIIAMTTKPAQAATSTPSSTVESGPTVTIDSATFTAEIASTTLERMSGLSFRPSLAPDHAMLFLFSRPGIQSFWMKDMNFGLDMIWIGHNKVLGFAQNVEPQPGAALIKLKIYSSPKGTDAVLEVVAGTVAQYGIKAGDSVEIQK